MRRPLALLLYLLAHCIARADPWDATLPAMVWARALDREGPSAESSVSRNFGWLEEQRLIRSERYKRMRRVFLLREDGSGDPYVRPKGNYFTVPLAFFLEDWHAELSLPAVAVLLIGRDLAPPFELRKEHAARWYGISADTLQRGLDELRDASLLSVTPRRTAAPRVRQGWTMVNQYRLLAPFDKPEMPASPDSERSGGRAR